ncbi:MAG: thiolase family protein [Eubacterium sp.]|nr:thiolase family protein [Eubacterium sp.]
MNYRVDNNPLKPYSRSVSIIGIGATPFMLTKDDPELDGLGEGELFGYAAIDAMKDAGLTAKDVDFFIQAQGGPGWQTDCGTPNMHVANWFGMKGKGSCHHSEACCTGYVALEQAVSYVASGAYDIVLSGTCDFSYSIIQLSRPSMFRRHFTEEMFTEVLANAYPKDYTRWSHAGGSLSSESWLDQYVKDNNIEDKIDDVLCTLSKNLRYTASLNPLSLNHNTYDDMAKMFRMENADKFLRSKFNPKIGMYMRASNFEQRADGAAAVIVCPTEMAYKYTDHPIEILGMGHSCLEAGMPQLERFATEAAYKQVRDLTGLTGKDMDLFMANDFFMQSSILAAEMCEYLPEGQGWEYALEGRTMFNGDAPINTNGGRCQYGHAHGTSGMHDLYEAVKQMRGEMGPTQVNRPVNYAMIRGFGGAQNLMCTILKKN